MKTNEWKKRLSKFLKVFFVLFIVFLISCAFYSSDQISYGRTILHEDLIFNDYYSSNELCELEFIDEDTVTYKRSNYFHKDEFTFYKWKYTYKEGVIFIYTGQITDEKEDIYKLVLLGNDKLMFVKYNQLLYLDD